ncbi:hypothetical protein CHS0354_015681 [Potamilus streckersoni]|uniref:Calcitonin receptor n=1 Tax=Potamilus streckersoni TaxID=2493646 RepID=A0AAE0SRJ9_9BIVA|nr:hypothetical protein CHS0354_015681 [Potamilus streckersoni]
MKAGYGILTCLLQLLLLPWSSAGIRINNTTLCRDRLGYFPKDLFQVSTCSLCYEYLTDQSKKFVLNKPVNFRMLQTKPFYLIKKNDASCTVYPKHENQTSMSEVCNTLSSVECTNWSACCRAAWNCCERQVFDDPEDFCPQTWDGWNCWNYTAPGKTVTDTCPSYIGDTDSGLKVSKKCTENGTWFISEKSNLEWSDYTNCVPSISQLFRNVIIISIVFNSVGLILLLLAIYIFCSYRQLRRQLRIRIHLNLMVSLLITGVFTMVWDVAVQYNRLVNKKDDSLMHSQEDVCKSLHIMRRMTKATNFFWMLCEGLYLHHLMINAFVPPKHLRVYFIVGWGIPAALFTLYAILRKTIADDSLCWTLPLTGPERALEWVLVNTPSILCLLLNFIFLLNILRIIVRGMVHHPNEPTGFRKALRATFVLVPLFGIHQFCLIYLPSSDNQPAFDIYQIASAIINNSQGIVIPLIFCYFNGEVSTIRNGVSWGCVQICI